MKQNYFVYNGKNYNTGTIIVIKWCNHITRTVLNTNAKFISYDTETKKYTVEIYGNEYTYLESDFFNILCNIVDTNKVNITETMHNNFSDELNIDGLLVAWVWYIFIMIIAVIFYDRIGIWIFASIVFFNYRRKKLKEEGYK